MKCCKKEIVKKKARYYVYCIIHNSTSSVHFIDSPNVRFIYNILATLYVVEENAKKNGTI